MTGSLSDATAAAGVPASTMLEALRAFITLGVDLERDPDDGDSFHVRYEQTFRHRRSCSSAWVVRCSAELHTAIRWTRSRSIRWRTLDGADRFWLANGKAPILHSIDLPLTMVSISSGFGKRANRVRPALGHEGNAVRTTTRCRRAAPARAAGGPCSCRAVVDDAQRRRLSPRRRARRYTPLRDGVVGARCAAERWLRQLASRSITRGTSRQSTATSPDLLAGIKAGMPVSQGELIGFVGQHRLFDWPWICTSSSRATARRSIRWFIARSGVRH